MYFPTTYTCRSVVTSVSRFYKRLVDFDWQRHALLSWLGWHHVNIKTALCELTVLCSHSMQTMKFALDDTLFSPVQELRNYYGEEVAFYFVWMDFLTCWLCVPAAVSAVLCVSPQPSKSFVCFW